MRVDVSGSQQNGTNDNVEIESRELVMGLRWDPSEHSVSPAEPHASLDACCALFDREFRAMEVVHPGHVWNADGSVIHTGDLKTGAGIWDDEQLFVFLEAVPYMISANASCS